MPTRRSLFLRLNAILISFAISLFASHSFASPEGVLCNRGDTCRSKGVFTKKSAGPTKKDAVRLNPAQVPIESITGIEVIDYKGSFDFGLVKGLGKIGAALSPSNSEETFFGPPAPEIYNQFLDRMTNREKYDAKKYTLAAAVNLFSHEGEGFNNYQMSLGVMARYNQALNSVLSGGGVLLIWGPITVGGSYYPDQDQIDPMMPGVSKLTLNSNVTTFDLGLALESVYFDYSALTVAGDAAATASVFTITGFIGRAILTAARREVNSTKPAFDFERQILIQQQSKVDLFLGAQYRIAPFLVLGAFYNYYLLHEGSLGVTVFF